VTLLLKQIFGLLKLINSETGTNQIASGIAAGFILGMSPLLSLQVLFLFTCILVFKIQIGAVFISAFFFAFIAWLFDPAFHALGSFLLETNALQGFFTALYNMPLLPFTRFNNSIVLGAGVLALALSPLIYLISKTLLIKYRTTVLSYIQQTKAWKVIKSTALFKWYYQYDKLYNS